MQEREVYVTGIGSYSPGEPIPFDKIDDVLGKIDGAPKNLLKRINRLRPIMKELLGIEYSYYALDPKTRKQTETNITMSVKSAGKALDMAGMEAANIDLLIYAGIVFDVWCPPSSVLVQDALNIPYCAEMSIHSNCTAIYKAIQAATDMIANGRYDNALVISSQLSSSILRAEYFNQKVLTEEQAILRWFLSDGAGALVFSSSNNGGKAQFKVVDTYLESVGAGMKPSMEMLAGASYWNVPEVYEKGWHHLTQDLKTVAAIAPKIGGEGILRMIEKTNLDVSTVKCFLLNVPTKHIMDLSEKIVRRNLQNPELTIYTKLASRGYQGVPAAIIALDEYTRENQLEPGDRIFSFVTESSKWMHAGFILEAC